MYDYAYERMNMQDQFAQFGMSCRRRAGFRRHARRLSQGKSGAVDDHRGAQHGSEGPTPRARLPRQQDPGLRLRP